MATNVILPALGMSQETGKIVRWLKDEGAQVTKGEPIAEIETDKATVELEASASGTLGMVSASAGDDVPVGQTIALIFSADEAATQRGTSKAQTTAVPASVPDMVRNGSINASPLAARIAAEHNLDLRVISTTGKRIQQADVWAYLQNNGQTLAASPISTIGNVTPVQNTRLVAASPKARRIAAEQGKDVTRISGTGPEGAVITADVMAAPSQVAAPVQLPVLETLAPPVDARIEQSNGTTEQPVSSVWRIMAERTTQSWTSVPHFSLVREVNASRLIAWREQLLKRNTSDEKITYTDLLVKVVALVLRSHPHLNATWSKNTLLMNRHINIGIAVATDDGLLVPVIPDADQRSIAEIARRRKDVVDRAQSGKTRPEDIQGSTFTISNLGMYGVDAFNAIINPPHAAILAVGRMAERVVPVEGQVKIQPMMVLTLSCDHRVVDGARGAQFLATLAEMIEEPLGLIG